MSTTTVVPTAKTNKITPTRTTAESSTEPAEVSPSSTKKKKKRKTAYNQEATWGDGNIYKPKKEGQFWFDQGGG